MEAQVPKVLYKYRAATSDKDLEILEQMIKEGSIYFGSSFGFNDIFDCKPVLTFEASDEDLVKRMIGHDMARAEAAGKVLDVKATETALRATLGTSADPRTPATGLQHQKRLGESLEKWGVFCAARRGDNILMWSHYANSFSGVCFEIKTESFGLLQPVQYQEKRPVVNVIPGVEKMRSITDKVFFTKSIDWKYEEEWRALGDKGVVNLPHDGIRRIIFGPKCPENIRQKIRGFIQDARKIIRVAEGRPSNSHFVLDIVDL